MLPRGGRTALRVRVPSDLSSCTVVGGWGRCVRAIYRYGEALSANRRRSALRTSGERANGTGEDLSGKAFVLDRESVSRIGSINQHAAGDQRAGSVIL